MIRPIVALYGAISFACWSSVSHAVVFELVENIDSLEIIEPTVTPSGAFVWSKAERFAVTYVPCEPSSHNDDDLDFSRDGALDALADRLGLYTPWRSKKPCPDALYVKAIGGADLYFSDGEKTSGELFGFGSTDHINEAMITDDTAFILVEARVFYDRQVNQEIYRLNFTPTRQARADSLDSYTQELKAYREKVYKESYLPERNAYLAKWLASAVAGLLILGGMVVLMKRLTDRLLPRYILHRAASREAAALKAMNRIELLRDRGLIDEEQFEKRVAQLRKDISSR